MRVALIQFVLVLVSLIVSDVVRSVDTALHMVKWGIYLEKVESITVYNYDHMLLLNLHVDKEKFFGKHENIAGKHLSRTKRESSSWFLRLWHNQSNDNGDNLIDELSNNSRLTMFNSSGLYEQNGTRRVKRGLFDFVGEGLSYLFGTATRRNVVSLKNNEQHLQDELKSLMGQIKQEHQDLLSLRNSVMNYDNEMESSILSLKDYYTRILWGSANEAIRINRLEAYIRTLHSEVIELLPSRFDKMRIDSALMSCANGQLPIMLVPTDTIANELNNLSLSLKYTDVNLALGTDNVMSYYGHHLTSCHFADNQHMMIRIRIPMFRGLVKPKLYKIHPIMFRVNNTSCQMKFRTTYMVGLGNKYYEINDKTISDCLLRSDPHLCMISEMEIVNKPNHCLNNIEKSDQNMLHTCTFECSLNTDVMVHRIMTNTYMIGNAQNRIVTYCQNSTDSIKYLISESEKTTGAYMVRLRCGCKLVVDGKEIATNRVHCSMSKPTEIEFLEHNWSSIYSDMTPEISNSSLFSQIMTLTNYTRNISVILPELRNLTEIKIAPINDIDSESEMTGNYLWSTNLVYGLLIFVTTITLTLCIILILICTCRICKRTRRRSANLNRNNLEVYAVPDVPARIVPIMIDNRLQDVAVETIN
jgi:hypothetical protein